MWDPAARREFRAGLRPVSAVFLSPGDPLPKNSVSTTVFGRELYQLALADCVVIDARQKRGLGIGVELAVARLLEKPVVSVVPPDSHYRPGTVRYRGIRVAEYVHPHLDALSDVIVNTFSDAGAWLQVFFDERRSAKTSASISNALRMYVEDVLPHDSVVVRIVRARAATLRRHHDILRAHRSVAPGESGGRSCL